MCRILSDIRNDLGRSIGWNNHSDIFVSISWEYSKQLLHFRFFCSFILLCFYSSCSYSSRYRNWDILNQSNWCFDCVDWWIVASGFDVAPWFINWIAAGVIINQNPISEYSIQRRKKKNDRLKVSFDLFLYLKCSI